MNYSNLLPSPRIVELEEEKINFARLTPGSAGSGVPVAVQERLGRMCEGNAGKIPVQIVGDEEQPAEGYELTIAAAGVSLKASGEAGFGYGLDRLEQLCVAGRLPLGVIRDEPAMGMRGFHVNFGGLRHMDCEQSLEVLEGMRRWNLNTVLIEYAERFPYRQHARISSVDALKREQVGALVSRSRELGIQVIPLQQCLGHVEHVLRHDEYAHLREEEEKQDQWCPLNEGSFDLFCELVDDVIETHPGLKMVHLGGDETRRLGECPRCAEFAREKGKGGLYLEFVQRAIQHVVDRGLTPIVWDDMICHYPEILDELPRELVIMYWEYWTTQVESAVFVARPEGCGVVVDRRWKEEWAGELDEVERRMIDRFTAPIDFETDFSAEFLDRFGPYLGEGFPKRVRAFPYLEYYRDRGFRVIGCGAGGSNYSLWNGLPDFPRYMDNIAAWSRRMAESGCMGVVTSAWYDFPIETLMPGIMCTGQTAWNPGV